MRGLLLASAALVAGPSVPPEAPPPPEPAAKPCPDSEKPLRPMTPDKPSDAQRFNPGLF